MARLNLPCLRASLASPISVAAAASAAPAPVSFLPPATATSVGPLTAGPLTGGRALIATGAAVPAATGGASGVTGTGAMATGFGGRAAATSLDPSRVVMTVSQPFAARPGYTGLQASPALALVTENT